MRHAAYGAPKPQAMHALRKATLPALAAHIAGKAPERFRWVKAGNACSTETATASQTTTPC